jgi:hypothetical protein
MRNGRELKPGETRRINCSCGKPAKFCEQSQFQLGERRSVSFHYWCPTCWVTPGPDSRSPKQRAA